MTSSASLGFLNVEQSLVSKARDICSDWDLVLTTVSWESRATATLPLLTGKSDDVRMLWFESTNADVTARKKAMADAATATLGKKIRQVDLRPSSECEPNFRTLGKLLEDEFSNHGRPLRILLDATCLPKKYLLYLLGVSFRREYAAKLTVLYAEGKYSSPKRGGSGTTKTHGLISDGDWLSVQVPYLESADYAPSKRDVVVTFGGEVGVAIPMIERLEPRQLILLQITADSPRLSKKQIDKEKRYVDLLLDQPNARLLEYDIGDAIGVARVLLTECQGATTCVAIGSKPHALGMGLAALADDRMEVVCRIPSAYTGVDAIATGRVMQFTIEDRFEPSAYLHQAPY